MYIIWRIKAVDLSKICSLFQYICRLIYVFQNLWADLKKQSPVRRILPVCPIIPPLLLHKTTCCSSFALGVLLYYEFWHTQVWLKSKLTSCYLIYKFYSKSWKWCRGRTGPVDHDISQCLFFMRYDEIPFLSMSLEERKSAKAWKTVTCICVGKPI